MTDTGSLRPLGRTLGETFYARAMQPEHEVAFRFIEPGGASLADSQVTELTFAALHEKAAIVARHFAEHAQVGDRALILCEPGVDYVAALFGCFYGGVVAVPAYPPMTTALDERVQRLAEDSDSRFLLTTSLLAAQCQALDLRRLDATVAVVNELPYTSAEYEPCDVEPDSIALLQYTSGSTGVPRGVMLSHTNVLSNVGAIAGHLRISREDQAVFWLPPYHDMGLMGGLFTPVLHGFGTTFMSPLSFLYDPFLWLEAMTKYGTTISAAPNFAFEMCLRKAQGRGVVDLDLSRLRVLINGAEPISRATIGRFSERFGEVGFRRSAFMPSYGLAEATLMVSGVDADDDVMAPSHSNGQWSEAGKDPAVSVGRAGANGVVLIVDPETKNECPEDETGEIWFQGPGVACGYWRNEKASRETFEGLLVDRPERGPFLRTGDLGVVREGELYIAGRLKDLIIVRGRNYYPHDIEKAVVESDPRIRPGCIAAFEVRHSPNPEVVVVAELRDDNDAADAETLWQNARRCVSEELGLVLGELALISRGTSLKTSSGKIRRRPTHDAFINGNLAIVARRRGDGLRAAPAGPVVSLAGELAQAPKGRRSGIALNAVRAHAAALLGEDAAGKVNPQLTFQQLGLDSKRAVELSGRLSEAIGVSLPPTLAYDYPTPLAVAAYLLVRLEGEGDEVDVQSATVRADEPIAIIGMSCRYPGGVCTPADLWQLVLSGGDAISEFPDDRGWDLDNLYDANPDRPGTSYTRQGGFVERVSDFDADFFSISPLEALLMDPQQRLVLEGAWEALEQARIDPEALKGSDASVFIGTMSYDYGIGSAFEAHHGFGSANVGGAMLSSRVAFALGIHGPAISLDGACSSGMVAIHLACQALRAGESALAIAGGVTVFSHPGMFRLFSRQRRLSADGRCKSFAAAADGAGFSEGMGLLAVERLADAQSNGRRILAIIRGSAMGHDGMSNGLTAPNGPSQERVIRRALANAGVAPDTVDAVEGQGSGTAIGDVIEAQALLATYGRGREDRPLWLGSVRSNIGHSHAAGGPAGVIKMVEAMRHGILPRTLHAAEPTPHVDWSAGMRLLTDCREWTAGEHPRRAGISSFGATGVDAHLILEEPPAPDNLAPASSLSELPTTPILISGKNAEAVRAQADRLLSFMLANPDTSPPDIALSLATTRPRFGYRAAVIGQDRDTLLAGLAALIRSDDPIDVLGPDKAGRAIRGKTALFFPAILPEAGRWIKQLEDVFPVFAQAHGDVSRALDRHAARLSNLQASQGPMGGQSASALPTFAFEVALSRLIESLDVEADCLVGEAMGELVAAHVGGALSLEDAALVAVVRSCLGSLQHERATDTLMATVAGLHLSEPQLPIFTTRTGQAITAEEAVSESLSADEIEPSESLAEVVRTLEQDEVRHLLVLGPGDGGAIAPKPFANTQGQLRFMHALEPGHYAPDGFIACLVHAHVYGVEVNWSELFARRGAKVVELPTYAFQRKRYWPDDSDDSALVLSDAARTLSLAGSGGEQ